MRPFLDLAVLFMAAPRDERSGFDRPVLNPWGHEEIDAALQRSKGKGPSWRH